MNDDELPAIAYSVRQPWAWAIIYARKDIENRSRFAARQVKRGRIAIHAGKGMTEREYWDAAVFMRDVCRVSVPPPHELQRGGVIGTVDVVDMVSRSSSPWFMGPCGLVLANPRPCAFVPAIGALGPFAWKPAGDEIVPAPAKWMRERYVQGVGVLF